MPYRKSKPLTCYLCGKRIEPYEDFAVRVWRSEPYIKSANGAFDTLKRTKAMYHLCKECSDKAIEQLVLEGEQHD